MTDDADQQVDHRADTRAHLLPEEQATGPSDDSRHQAEIILADSDRRTAEPEQTKHESTQTPERPSHAS